MNRRVAAGGGLRLGAHMSIGGGMPRAVERAVSVGATALQVFVKSARQWSARPLPPSEVGGFREQVLEHDLAAHTLAHASYLINLACPDDGLWERSIEALSIEVDRCAQLGIPYLVVHPGSHLGAGEQSGLRRVARALDRVLTEKRSASGARKALRPSVTVLLENTAGQGSNLGHDFEHLGQAIRQARSAERLGVCFDTCHAVAAGYEIDGPSSYRETFAAFERDVGLERLRAFHLNDSKFPAGSRRDRHEHIGRGSVGLDGFRRILNDRKFRKLPMVLETPKGRDLAEDRQNLSTLRSLVRGHS